jgi:hypothetical protein
MPADHEERAMASVVTALPCRTIATVTFLYVTPSTSDATIPPAGELSPIINAIS